MSGKARWGWACLTLLLGGVAGAQEASLLQPAPRMGWLEARAQEVPEGLLLGHAPEGLGRVQAGSKLFVGFGRSRYDFILRQGYMMGLPIPEDVAKLEDAIDLSSNGAVIFGAGPVTWLKVEVEGFREAAGARRYRFVALPALIVRPVQHIPIQAGISVLVAFKRRPDAYSDERRRALGFLQLSGRF